MPKLPKAKAKAAAEVEPQDFTALPEGIYVVQLVDVDATKEGVKGPYWSWEFDIVEPEEHANRKLWVNTSLADGALWKMREVYDAFGYTTDSDTDEMIGEKIKVAVSQRVIDQGSRKGALGNNVDKCMPLGDSDGDGPTKDDVF